LKREFRFTIKFARAWLREFVQMFVEGLRNSPILLANRCARFIPEAACLPRPP
jgi:hypothetical protein